MMSTIYHKTADMSTIKQHFIHKHKRIAPRTLKYYTFNMVRKVSGCIGKKSGPVNAVVAFTNTSFRNDANPLDLNELIVKNPNSTFFMQVDGNSWAEQGIWQGDVVVIDRSLTAKPGDTVVLTDGEELVVAKYNDFSGDESVLVWGVVTHTVHKRRR